MNQIDQAVDAGESFGTGFFDFFHRFFFVVNLKLYINIPEKTELSRGFLKKNEFFFDR